jgi:hypothetical protein
MGIYLQAWLLQIPLVGPENFAKVTCPMAQSDIGD